VGEPHQLLTDCSRIKFGNGVRYRNKKYIALGHIRWRAPHFPRNWRQKSCYAAPCFVWLGKLSQCVDLRNSGTARTMIHTSRAQRCCILHLRMKALPCLTASDRYTTMLEDDQPPDQHVSSPRSICGGRERLSALTQAVCAVRRPMGADEVVHRNYHVRVLEISKAYRSDSCTCQAVAKSRRTQRVCCPTNSCSPQGPALYAIMTQGNDTYLLRLAFVDFCKRPHLSAS
jgi:hypothetical protein